MWDDVTSLDLDHLTCSLCLEYLLPPLYNCSAGHTNACGSCFIELGNNPGCPICRCPMTGMRNFALEGIVRSTPLTCKFKENGCRSCPTGAEYTAHVLNCKFRELVICPLKSSGRLRSCEWKGAIPSVAGHLKNDHDFKNVITAGKGALIIQNVLEAQTPQIGLAMALLEPEDHDVGFLIYIRKMDSEVTIVVQGLGTATEMDNFKFSNGHTNTCGKCYAQLGIRPECPTCRGTMSGIRNFTLEGIVGSTPIPCKFKENGCQSHPSIDEYPAHVLNCKFSEKVSCPLNSSGCPRSSCGWMGTIPSVAGHLKDQHERLITTGKGDNVTLTIEKILTSPKLGIAMALLESCDHNMGFLIYIRKEDPEVTFVVQGLGTATEMSKFKISLGLVSENPRSSLRWETYPLPISKGFEWKSSGSVWSVPVEMAKAFQSNGSLHILLGIQLVTVNSTR